MSKAYYALSNLLEIIVIALLATMACLVFFNVVLRYGFNSGLSITEELSRYLFVWVVFLGAILAFNDGGHVNVSIFVDKLSARKQLFLSIVTNAMMLYCCVLIFIGSYKQMILNMSNYSPISGIPTGVNFFACALMSFVIAMLLVGKLYLQGTALLNRSTT